jgi:hypothetical protein
LPKKSGVCTTTQETLSSIQPTRSSAAVTSGGSVTTSSFAMRERVFTTSAYCGCRPPESTALRRLVTRCAISTASAVPVEPSYMEAFATSMPVRFATWVWNSKRYCSVPCAISG